MRRENHYSQVSQRASRLSEGCVFGERYQEELKAIFSGNEYSKISEDVVLLKKSMLEEIETCERKKAENEGFITSFFERIKELECKLLSEGE